MRYLVTKIGVQVSTVYAQRQTNGDIFWVASRNKATEFNLTEARKIAREEDGVVQSLSKPYDVKLKESDRVALLKYVFDKK
jgi:hypothetical protein